MCLWILLFIASLIISILCIYGVDYAIKNNNDKIYIICKFIGILFGFLLGYSFGNIIF